MASGYREDEEAAEIRKLEIQLAEDGDSFEIWEQLVRAAESLEGGLSRNSSPQAIQTVRSVYDRFLAKFPLFFGYWKKYADLEFSIGGTESAELIYERGVSSIASSVDLWTNYCAFKVETCHDPEIIRELFERAASSVGLDFLSHPFWDKYLDFEERLEHSDRIFSILKRVIEIPMHQYARYFDRYRTAAPSQPLSSLLDAAPLDALRAALDAEAQNAAHMAGAPYTPVSEAEREVELRARIDALALEIFTRTQAETTKRWTYESEVKRPYFHVKELGESELDNWRKYLSFEESEGDYARTCFLYERCLVTCAFYDEFWFRYLRYVAEQEEISVKSGGAKKTEEQRNIYLRAACIFVPIALPQVRLDFAYFEEVNGRLEVAEGIHEAVLLTLPSHEQTIISLAHLQRRHRGLEPAIATLEEHIGNAATPALTKAALAAELAGMLWRGRGSGDEARMVYLKSKGEDYCQVSGVFWERYLDFELALPTDLEREGRGREDVIRSVVDGVRRSRIEAEVKRGLLRKWMGYLMERGQSSGAMAEWLKTEREVALYS